MHDERYIHEVCNTPCLRNKIRAAPPTGSQRYIVYPQLGRSTSRVLQLRQCPRVFGGVGGY